MEEIDEKEFNSRITCPIDNSIEFMNMDLKEKDLFLTDSLNYYLKYKTNFKIQLGNKVYESRLSVIPLPANAMERKKIIIMFKNLQKQYV